MQTIRARAPVRFCDLGGWTDTRIVPSGAVLNFTATLYTHVTLQLGAFSGISIESFDTDEQTEIRDIRQIEYNSVLDLFKAAIKRTGIRRGVRILVRSDAPPGSGLGSSAALGVATMAALARYLRWQLLPYEVARESQALETEELGLECGVQDQLASAFGGVSFMEVTYPHARVFPVPLDTGTLCELEDRFVLVYTGHSHFSSAMHEKVIAEYRGGPQPARLPAPGGVRRPRQGVPPGRRPRRFRRGDERELGRPEGAAPGHHHPGDRAAP